ncbi:MAG: metal ABC transporter permease, partial [Verrucomicrobiota bacterium]
LILSRRLWLVMILAVMAAMAATLIGLYASFTADLPTNQTICVAACAILALALPVGTVRYVLRRLHKRQSL